MLSWLASRPRPAFSPLAGRSYWQRRGGAPDAAASACPAPDVPERADYVIVGGGFAGLSTAIHLADAEPGARVVLLEASFIGYGASGRNAGLLAPLPAPIWLMTAERNEEHAWALRHLHMRVQGLAQWLKAEAPAAEIASSAIRIEAKGRCTEAGLASVARILSAIGVEHASSRSPEGRLHIDLDTHVVQPYRAVLALGEGARRRGVRICEGARVAAVEETPTGVEVALESGVRLVARRAVVCTNAYTASLSLPEQPRARPAHNFMVATHQIEPQRLGYKADAQWFVVELNGSYVYYRHHAGRIIYGGIERLRLHGSDDFSVPPDVLAKLEQLLAHSFPGGGLTPAEIWGGVYHQTATDLPVIRCIGARGTIVLNVGYGGTGVAMSQICAPIVAALARGVEPALADDRRLLAAIASTRVPILAAASFIAGVAMDLLPGRRRQAVRAASRERGRRGL